MPEELPLPSDPLLLTGVRGNLKPLGIGDAAGLLARVPKEAVVLPRADGDEPLAGGLDCAEEDGLACAGEDGLLPPPTATDFVPLPAAAAENLMLPPLPPGAGLLLPPPAGAWPLEAPCEGGGMKELLGERGTIVCLCTKPEPDTSGPDTGGG